MESCPPSASQMAHPIDGLRDAIPPPLENPAIRGPRNVVMGNNITTEIASIFQGRALDDGMFSGYEFCPTPTAAATALEMRTLPSASTSEAIGGLVHSTTPLSSASSSGFPQNKSLQELEVTEGFHHPSLQGSLGREWRGSGTCMGPRARGLVWILHRDTGTSSLVAWGPGSGGPSPS